MHIFGHGINQILINLLLWLVLCMSLGMTISNVSNINFILADKILSISNLKIVNGKILIGLFSSQWE
jgi:hypothetical protein